MSVLVPFDGIGIVGHILTFWKEQSHPFSFPSPTLEAESKKPAKLSETSSAWRCTSAFPIGCRVANSCGSLGSLPLRQPGAETAHLSLQPNLLPLALFSVAYPLPSTPLYKLTDISSTPLGAVQPRGSCSNSCVSLTSGTVRYTGQYLQCSLPWENVMSIVVPNTHQCHQSFSSPEGPSGLPG